MKPAAQVHRTENNLSAALMSRSLYQPGCLRIDRIMRLDFARIMRPDFVAADWPALRRPAAGLVAHWRRPASLAHQITFNPRCAAPLASRSTATTGLLPTVLFAEMLPMVALGVVAVQVFSALPPIGALGPPHSITGGEPETAPYRHDAIVFQFFVAGPPLARHLTPSHCRAIRCLRAASTGHRPGPLLSIHPPEQDTAGRWPPSELWIVRISPRPWRCRHCASCRMRHQAAGPTQCSPHRGISSERSAGNRPAGSRTEPHRVCVPGQ